MKKNKIFRIKPDIPQLPAECCGTCDWGIKIPMEFKNVVCQATPPTAMVLNGQPNSMYPVVARENNPCHFFKKGIVVGQS